MYQTTWHIASGGRQSGLIRYRVGIAAENKAAVLPEKQPLR
ncbi:hypothetical protein [Pontibacter sp. HSC-36F09]|nr:hypothetical protein [Pontibacter sp. HSC-36F09]MCP2045174.1 hypothetical protein [Pontibacter sp. HSC-36F09]